jgi:hypothetical protein
MPAAQGPRCVPYVTARVSHASRAQGSDKVSPPGASIVPSESVVPVLSGVQPSADAALPVSRAWSRSS